MIFILIFFKFLIFAVPLLILVAYFTLAWRPTYNDANSFLTASFFFWPVLPTMSYFSWLTNGCKVAVPTGKILNLKLIAAAELNLKTSTALILKIKSSYFGFGAIFCSTDLCLAQQNYLKALQELQELFCVNSQFQIAMELTQNNFTLFTLGGSICICLVIAGTFVGYYFWPTAIKSGSFLAPSASQPHLVVKPIAVSAKKSFFILVEKTGDNFGFITDYDQFSRIFANCRESYGEYIISGIPNDLGFQFFNLCSVLITLGKKRCYNEVWCSWAKNLTPETLDFLANLYQP